VFDASVLLRAVLVESEEALAWIERLQAGELEAVAPELIWAEVTSGLALEVRLRDLDAQLAAEALEALTALPLETRDLVSSAGAALAVAWSRGLSAYDAFYLALAEAADAVLVTADHKLANAATRAELIA
jgi:predicted nucleic acid-binding protein